MNGWSYLFIHFFSHISFFAIIFRIEIIFFLQAPSKKNFVQLVSNMRPARAVHVVRNLFLKQKKFKFQRKFIYFVVVSIIWTINNV